MRRSQVRSGLAWLCLAGLLMLASSLQAATPAQIDEARAKALAWLVSHQQGDGSWRSGAGSELQASALSLRALSNAGVRGVPYARGLAWLANTEAHSVDALSHQILAMNSAGMNAETKLDQLIDWRNRLQAWGTYAHYTTGFPDTPLAIGAIRESSRYLAQRTSLLNAMCQILQAQKPDGSWAFAPTLDETLWPSNSGAILPTTYNILELQAFVDLGYTVRTCAGNSYSFSSVIDNAVNWLINHRLRADGGFSEPKSLWDAGTAMSTALVFRALSVARPSAPAGTAAQDFLIENQAANGSWQDDALVTALVATTFPSTTLADMDQDGVPDVVEVILGTDPNVYDSRRYATGNGQGVAGVHSAYHFTADRNQIASLYLGTAYGMDTDDTPPTPPSADAYDFGTIALGASRLRSIPMYQNTTTSTVYMDMKLDRNGYGAYSIGGGNYISSIPVAPGATLNVDVLFSSLMQTPGIKNERLVVGKWLVPPGEFGTDIYVATQDLTGVIGSVSAGKAYYSGWTIVLGNLPPGMALDPVTGLVTGMPTEAGTYNFTVVAENLTTGETRTLTFQIVVNSPPQVTTPQQQAHYEGDVIALDIVATDSDDDFLTYTTSGLPGGLSINPATGHISGRLGYKIAGDYTTTVTVSDGKSDVVVTFDWAITTTVRSPIMENPVALSNREGDTVEISLNAYDPDGDPLTFSSTGLPPGLSVDANGTIVGTIGYDTLSTYNVGITASDGISTPTQITFVWLITDVNQAPLLDPLGIQALFEEDILTIELNASDPDGDGLVFSTTTLPPFVTPQNNGDGTGSLLVAPGQAHAGVYDIRVTVTDDNPASLSSSQNLILVVNDRTGATDVVRLQTTLGVVEIELYGELAPATVANFLQYVNDGDFDTSFIHDLIHPGIYSNFPGGLIQSGYLRLAEPYTVPQDPPVVHESALSNRSGTIGMLRIDPNDPNSATSIWYMNFGDNSDTLDAAGYAVFGRVIRGWNALIQIASLPTYNVTNPPNTVSLPRLPVTGTPISGDWWNYVVSLNPVNENALTAKDYGPLAMGGAPFRSPLPIPIGGVGPYTYHITSGYLPSGIALDSATGLMTGTTYISGEYVSEYTVIDSVGNAASGTIVFTVNTPPTLEIPATQQHEEGQAVSLQIQGGGAEEGETLEYGAANLPPGLSIDPATGLISGVINAASANTYNSVVWVDDENYRAYTGFIWIIDGASGLTFTAIPATYTMNEGQTLTVPLSASGAATVCFSLEGSPLGFVSLVDNENGTGEVVVSPGYTDSGSYTITVDVQNWCDDNPDSEIRSQSFTVHVNDVNQPPSVENPGNQTSTAGGSVSLKIQATDAEDDPLQYDAINLPPGLDIDLYSGLISGTIGYEGAGTYQVYIGVLDEAAAKIVVVGFNWTVLGQNLSPQAVNDNASLERDTQVVLDVLANDSDPNEDALSVSSVTTPAHGIAVLNSDNTITYTPNAQYSGADSFTYTIADTQGAMDSATVFITVTSINSLPVIDHPGDQVSMEGATIELPMSATDAEGNTILYSAIGLPQGLSINSDTGVISGTLGYYEAGDYSVEVSASDGTDIASVTFGWSVLNTSRAPSANPDYATTEEVTPVIIDVLGNDNDPDGDELRVVAAGDGGNGIFVINADNTITYTPNTNFNGVDEFNYTIDDGNGLEATGVITVIVTIVDTDGNGISDLWEMEHFGWIGISPDGDADGDGISNLDEFLQGGDPLEGDVNGDGELNAADLLLAKRHVLDLIQLNPAQEEILDLAPAGGNGVTDLGDIVVLQRRIMAAH